MLDKNSERSLGELDTIRKKSLKRLARNCRSESMRNAATLEIDINYTSAKLWIKKVYIAGHVGKLDLSKTGSNEDTTAGYYSSHLYYHLKQIRMLGQRQS